MELRDHDTLHAYHRISVAEAHLSDPNGTVRSRASARISLFSGIRALARATDSAALLSAARSYLNGTEAK
jgi:hypothetical protein